MAKKRIKFYDVTDFVDNKFQNVNGGLDYDLENTLSKHGRTFTPKAAAELIRQKLNEYTKPEDATKTMAVEFSKSALMQILAQEDCEGIRFTFCKGINDADGSVNTDESLVALGLDGKGKPLGGDFYKSDVTPSATLSMPLSIEKGNKITVQDLKNELLPAEISRQQFESRFIKSFK